MMRLILGYALLLGDILARLLPVLVTAVISVGGIGPRKGNNRKVGVVSLVSHLCLYILQHRFLLHSWNIAETVKEIEGLRFTYQGFYYFSISLSVSMAVAVPLGLAFRYGFSFFSEDRGAFVLRSIRRKEKIFLFLSTAVLGIVVAACCFVGGRGPEHIVINEIWGNNRAAVVEGNEVMPDYIELYNNGVFACEAQGLYLSDSEDALKKREVPSRVIPPGGYMLVLLDDGSFSLKREGGETIFLSDASGRILDRVTAEATDTYFSYARQSDGNAAWTALSCTPGAANADGVRKVKSPVLSHEGGFYPEDFYLELSSEPGTSIYYTLDGSVPTTEDFLYQEPVYVYDRSPEENRYRSIPNVTWRWPDEEQVKEPVDKAFIIRAVAVYGEGDEQQISEPVTATYLIGQEKYRQRAVVSLVADPEELFGEDGIYVTGKEYDTWYLGGQEGDRPDANFRKKGREWEIAADFSYFSDALSFSQKAGLRIQGAGTRSYALKNFTIFARKEYGGSRVFDRNIFGDVASHKLVLRGSLANAICQTLVEDRDIAVREYVPVSVFLNGEFWYHANLMEKYDVDYFEQRYGISEDNLILFSNGLLEIGTEEDLAVEQAFYDYLDTHNMGDAASYEAIGEMIDLQSYIDYICVNVYIDNMDFSDTKNVVMWRARDTAPGPYGDGKWRWALYDLDAMEWANADLWGLDSPQQKNTFSFTQRAPGWGSISGSISVNQQRIYSALKESPDFRGQFVLTFMDLVNQNFRYEAVEAALDAYGYEQDGYKGGRDRNRTWPRSYYDDFFRERADYIVPYMAEEFGLTGTPETVTLSVSDTDAGTVAVNTITPDLSGGSWRGEYYTDYPITVTAKARVGYEFVRWEKTTASGEAEKIEYEEKTLEIPVEKGGIRLYAVFKKVG